MTRSLRIGTRGSRLALAQADWVQRQLVSRGVATITELVVIRTSGDRFTQQPLSAIGGKGLFVKEIEEALLAGAIDCAVHSLKDLPADLARGLIIAAVPEREDARDVLVSRTGGGLAALPRGARVGTSSVRRAALLRALRRDLTIAPVRGNVDTRLRQLDAGSLDALVLASAGLRRLGTSPPHSEPLAADEFVPAIGQGALAVESRAGEMAEQLRPLEHLDSRRAVDAERALLQVVGGSCVTPLAAHATINGETLSLRAMIAQPDGRRVIRGERHGRSDDGVAIGQVLGEELLRRGGAEILRALEATP